MILPSKTGRVGIPRAEGLWMDLRAPSSVELEPFSNPVVIMTGSKLGSDNGCNPQSESCTKILCAPPHTQTQGTVLKFPKSAYMDTKSQQHESARASAPLWGHAYPPHTSRETKAPDCSLGEDII